jgi:hypothetical protein
MLLVLGGLQYGGLVIFEFTAVRSVLPNTNSSTLHYTTRRRDPVSGSLQRRHICGIS